MPRPLVYLIYNILLPLVLAAGFPSFILKGIRRGGLARNFRQRLGHFHPETIAALKKRNPLWIHAVSVGEIFIALKVVEALHSRNPNLPVVLSTTTTTGYAVAEEKSSANLVVIHNPVDLPWITARVIRRLSPCALVLIEAEIWPNLVHQMKKRGRVVQLINARLSPRSARRYETFRSFIEPVFSQLDTVTVPFERDRERWIRLGIPAERIEVTGSVKFDQATAREALDVQLHGLREWLAATGMPEGSRIVLAGSTHEGEELLMARVLASLREEFPALALVVVPRHAERGQAIATSLAGQGFDPILKVPPGTTVLSESGVGQGRNFPSNRVECTIDEGSIRPAADPAEVADLSRRIWIANTTGELRAWFHLAEVVAIGKSFFGAGGQNPVEPILAGKPVVVGPNMQNFSDVVGDLVATKGICQVADETALPAALHTLLSHPESGLAMAKRGAAAMARHEGAAARNAALILRRL